MRCGRSIKAGGRKGKFVKGRSFQMDAKKKMLQRGDDRVEKNPQTWQRAELGVTLGFDEVNTQNRPGSKEICSIGAKSRDRRG